MAFLAAAGRHPDGAGGLRFQRLHQGRTRRRRGDPALIGRPMTRQHRTVSVEGLPVALDIQVLGDDERQRAAASIAWFTALEIDEQQAPQWQRFVSDVVSPHVTFTIDEALMPEATSPWWTELMRTAASEF